MNHEQVILICKWQGTPGLGLRRTLPLLAPQPDEIQALADKGIWVTVNAASLAGAYGPEMYRSRMHCSKTAPPR